MPVSGGIDFFEQLGDVELDSDGAVSRGIEFHRYRHQWGITVVGEMIGEGVAGNVFSFQGKKHESTSPAPVQVIDQWVQFVTGWKAIWVAGVDGWIHTDSEADGLKLHRRDKSKLCGGASFCEAQVGREIFRFDPALGGFRLEGEIRKEVICPLKGELSCALRFEDWLGRDGGDFASESVLDFQRNLLGIAR